MKVCVTGSSGFLGKYVLSELSTKNIQIIPVIKTSNKKKDISQFKNIKILDLHNFNTNVFSELDLPDSLIHLAWSGLPNYKSQDHIDKELPAQYKFLEKLISAGLKNITVAGTCFEYGMINGCINETMNAKPSNPYGIAKETLFRKLQKLQKKYNFNLKWCRIFYLHGHGQHINSLWSQIINDVSLGKKLFKMSGGEQIRDFLHVKEVAKHLVSLSIINNDVGIVNICSGKPITVKNLVNSWIIENKWNIKPKLNVYGYPDYEPMAFWGSNRKLKKILKENYQNI